MGKHKCTTVGYGYALNFIYAFCERAEELSGYKMRGKVLWEGSLTNSGDGFCAPTGKRGEKYKSDFNGHSLMQVFLGNDQKYPQSHFGLCYKNICTVHFRNYDYRSSEVIPEAHIPATPTGAFVGDSTTAIPEYEVRLGRYNLFPSETTNKVLTGVNPIWAIKDILVNQMGISGGKIDDASFRAAAQICADEKLGISFVMTREKKVLDWIKEILRYADGIFYYDIFEGLYKIKLFRKDYNEDDLPIIDDSVLEKCTIEQTTWNGVTSTFIFKYTDAWSGKENTYTVTNTATISINGYETTKTFKYYMLTSAESLPPLVSRALKKHGIPLSSAKLRINYVAAMNFRPGDVFILHSDRLKIVPKVFRIMKLGADSEDKPYIDIEAIEDMYSREIDAGVVPEPPGDDPTNIILDEPPAKFKVFSMPADYVITRNERPFMTVAAPNQFNDLVLTVDQQNDYGAGSRTASPFRLGKIVQASKANLSSLAEVGYNRDFKLLLDNGDGYFDTNIFLNEEEFQRGGLLLATGVGDKPLVLARSLQLVGNGNYALVTGVACLDTIDANFYQGDTADLYTVNWSDNRVFVRRSSAPTRDEIIPYETSSDYCETGDANDKYSLRITYSNTYYTSPPADVKLSGCFTYEIPVGVRTAHFEYDAVNEVYKLRWRPRNALFGASFQDADEYVLDEETEGKYYGRVALERLNSSGDVLDVYQDYDSSLTIDSDGYITIEIPKTDAESCDHWGIFSWTDTLGGSISDGSYINYGNRKQVWR